LSGLTFATHQHYTSQNHIAIFQHDKIHGKWEHEPISGGPCDGERIHPDKFDKLLDEYYELRGWDKNGIPTAATLTALGLEDVNQDIEPKRAQL